MSPEVCPTAASAVEPQLDLSRALNAADRALHRGSTREVLEALVVIRRVLRARLNAGVRDDAADLLVGPWQRRLRKRYEASLCALERLLPKAMSEPRAWQARVRRELEKLRRLDDLESQAYFDSLWIDIGVGD